MTEAFTIYSKYGQDIETLNNKSSWSRLWSIMQYLINLMLKSSELRSCLTCAYEMQSISNKYANGSMKLNTKKQSQKVHTLKGQPNKVPQMNSNLEVICPRNIRKTSKIQRTLQ